MGFYGNITKTSNTQFTFDKVYPNRKTMEEKRNVDGVYVGRYVLVEYDESGDFTGANRVYRKETVYTLTEDKEFNPVKTYYQRFLDASGRVESYKVYTVAPSMAGVPIPDGIILYEKNLMHNDTDESLDGILLYTSASCGTPYRYTENAGNASYSVGYGSVVYVDEAGPRLEAATGGPYTFYVCTGKTVEGYAVFNLANGGSVDTLGGTTSQYAYNYSVDYQKYGNGRGYDSTVWQKVYTDGVEKYVMIAEMNSVVPSFALATDAPSMTPIPPHFDENSTSVYYKLHAAPNWGLRIKAANPNLETPVLDEQGGALAGFTSVPMTEQSEARSYPSDQMVAWKRTSYDSKGNVNTTYYYDPNVEPEADGTAGNPWIDERQMLEGEPKPKVAAAIYWNNAGFNPNWISYSYETNAITIEPTGYSGHQYEVHNGKSTYGTKLPQVDTQELSIMLPGIGNAISNMWDIVYGGRNTTDKINYSGMRNMDIQWEDGQNPKRQGLRMVDEAYDVVEVDENTDLESGAFYIKLNGEYRVTTYYDPGATYYKKSSGYMFDTRQVDTLAGCINSVHDLMGMIIVDLPYGKESDCGPMNPTIVSYDPDTFKKNSYRYDFIEGKVVVDKEEDLDAAFFDPNKIYYCHKDKSYRRKGVGYTYTPIKVRYVPVADYTGEPLIAEEYRPNIYYYKSGENFVADIDGTFDATKDYYVKIASDSAEDNYYVPVDLEDFMPGYYTKDVNGNYYYDYGTTLSNSTQYYRLREKEEDITPTDVAASYMPYAYYVQDEKTGAYNMDPSELPGDHKYYQIAPIAVINPLPEQDQIHYKFDENGQKIPVFDEEGQPMVDEFGMQIFEVDDEYVYYVKDTGLYEGRPLQYIYVKNEFYYHPTVKEYEAYKENPNGKAEDRPYITEDRDQLSSIWLKESRPGAPFDDVQYYIWDRRQTKTDAGEDEGDTAAKYIGVLGPDGESRYKVNLLPYSPHDYYGDKARAYQTEYNTAWDELDPDAEDIEDQKQALKDYYEPLIADMLKRAETVYYSRQGSGYVPLNYDLLKTSYINLGLRQLEYEDKIDEETGEVIGKDYSKFKIDPETNDYIPSAYRKTTGETYYELILTPCETFYVAGYFFYREGKNWMLDLETYKTEGRTYYYSGDLHFDPLSNSFYAPNKYYFKDETNNKFKLARELQKRDIQYYEKLHFFVYSDTLGVVMEHSVWNRAIDIIPCTVELALQQPVAKMLTLKDFARTMNTIHGLIIRVNQMLLDGDYDTRDRSTVQGCINSLNDIINKFETLDAHTFVITDDYGRAVSAKFTSKQIFSAHNYGTNTDIGDMENVALNKALADYEADKKSLHDEFAEKKAALDARLAAEEIDESAYNTELELLNEELAFGLDGADEYYQPYIERYAEVHGEDRWLNVDMDSNSDEPKIVFGHAMNRVPDTTTVSDKNAQLTDKGEATALGLNNSTDNNLKLYTPIVDAMGHVVGHNIETVKLANTLRQISVGEASTAVTDMESKADTVVSKNTHDDFKFSAGNKWIHLAGDNDSNGIKIAHEVNAFEAGSPHVKYGLTDDESKTTLDVDNTFEVPVFKFDEAGHITFADTNVITIPETYNKFTSTTSDDSATDSTVGTAASTTPSVLEDEITLAEGNRWINIETTGDKVTLKHYVKGFTETTDTVDQNNEANNTFAIQELSWDRAGHVTASKKVTYTLPNNFKQVTFKNSGAASASVNGSANDVTFTAAKTVDGFTMDTGNRWIVLQSNGTDKNAVLYHAPAGTTVADTLRGNASAQAPKFGDTFKTVRVGLDAAGHVSTLEHYDVTIPQNNLVDTTANGADVITQLSLDKAKGEFTSTRTNVGALKLTGYSIASSDGTVAASDTLNVALGKIAYKLSVLQGNENVAGSVAQQIAAIVNADQNNKIDKLKEIADWINNDAVGAATMKTNISTLQTEVEKSGTGLLDRVSALETNITGGSGTSGVGGRVTALEGLVGSKSVATQISEGAVQTVSLGAGATNGTLKLTVDGTAGTEVAVPGVVTNDATFAYPASADHGITAQNMTISALVTYIAELEKRIYALEHPATTE